MKRGNITLARRQKSAVNCAAAVFLAPVMILLIIYFIYPIVESFRISAFKWNGISSEPHFIGLDNWTALLSDKKFWASFFNNIKIMVLSILIQIPVGLGMATFAEFAGKKAKIFKVLWFIPMLMSSVAIGFLFRYVLATDGGVISSISQLFIGKNIDLLGNPKLALYAVIGVIAWQFIPFYMVYCVAAYTNIPVELYEASIIDGANRWQYFVRIGLPLLSPSLKSAAILSMVGSLKYCDLVYVMTGGGPGTATELMATYMYKLSFSNFKMGYGSTVASGMFILISVMSLLMLKLLNSKKENN